MALSEKVQTAVDLQENGRIRELVRRARRDDAAAWEALVHAHQEPVFRLAYLIVGNAADAEEIAQDAFVRAYLSLAKFDAERPFRPWILQIARNLARNRRRRRTRGRLWSGPTRSCCGRRCAG